MALRSRQTAGGEPQRSGSIVTTPVAATPRVATEDGRPTVTGWLRLGKDGRLSAYAPATGGVARWTETRPGGAWTGPELVAPGKGLQSHLSVAQGPDGYVHLAALRQTPIEDGGTWTELVHAIQYQTGRPVKNWAVVGSPYPRRDWKLGLRMGHPSVGVDSLGNAQIVVRNAFGGVSARGQEPSGKWAGWADLNGNGADRSISVVAAEGGRMFIHAPSDDGIMRFRRAAADAKFERVDKLPGHPETATVNGLETGEDGSVTFFLRDADSGELRAWRGDGPMESLGGRGSGPVAVLRKEIDGVDCTVLAQRDRDGRPAIAAYPTEQEEAGVTWTPTGEVCVGAPALTVDADGRVVLGVFTVDGGLRITRQRTDEPGLALEAWQQV
ncbi:hypothetical protein DWB77_01850 [Streptomyces hundungensis]|uniref:Uncharacterized protein n=1 Tax=Streptomyces hundungensis TaxID=1077946 RepID=A0A387HG29_9ACTN|nr:hypothetical protein [Streptomyces hundungensis]AYG79732.1 hypothetical protein DWB77_01850 [Streptomyces hundungensis]